MAGACVLRLCDRVRSPQYMQLSYYNFTSVAWEKSLSSQVTLYINPKCKCSPGNVDKTVVLSKAASFLRELQFTPVVTLEQSDMTPLDLLGEQFKIDRAIQYEQRLGFLLFCNTGSISDDPY